MRKFTTAVSAAALAVGLSGTLAAGELCGTDRVADATSVGNLQLAQAGDYQKRVAPAPDSEVRGREAMPKDQRYPSPKRDQDDATNPGQSPGSHPGSRVEGRDPDRGTRDQQTGEEYPTGRNPNPSVGVDRN